MYKWFKPTVYLKGFEQLSPGMLQRLGVRALLLDVDNTLSNGHGFPIAPEAEAHLQVLQDAGILLCVLSNNNEERVSSFAKPLGLFYVAHAKKPSASGVLRALEMLKVKKEETMMVGDQLYTDIWGGNRGGIKTTLVQPRGGAETFFIRLKRALEHPFLYRIERDKTILRGDYDD